MPLFKTLLNFVLSGALLGAAVSSWLSPKYLRWDNTATLGTQTVCDLPVVVEQLADHLIHLQLIGAGVGALLGLALGLFISRTKKNTAPPASTTTVPGTL